MLAEWELNSPIRPHVYMPGGKEEFSLGYWFVALKRILWISKREVDKLSHVIYFVIDCCLISMIASCCTDDLVAPQRR